MINQAGLEIIKHFEGRHLKYYFCPSNLCTIGYGSLVRNESTGRAYRRGDIIPEHLQVITEERAEELLIEDLERIENEIKTLVGRNVWYIYNDNERAAITSLIFNIGSGTFQRSRLKEQIINFDRKGIIFNFPTFRRGAGIILKGLVIRRAVEALLFWKGILDFDAFIKYKELIYGTPEYNEADK